MKSDFEDRRERRIERLDERSEKAERESAAAFKRVDAIASNIPLGQPILVGHHSEKRHRRDIERIQTGMRQGVDLEKKSKDLAARAEAARRNTAIFSDDPNAVEKLAAKIERLEAKQTMMREANKLVRKNDTEGLLDMGFSAASIDVMIKGDDCGRTGFADYQLQNNGANIRRLKLRLAQQQELDAAVDTETLIGDVRIVQSAEDNRTQIFFPGKPSDAIRARLKSASFRWAPSVGAWQRHLSNGAQYRAQEIAVAVIAEKSENA